MVDRTTVRDADRGRIAESVELALKEGKGKMRAVRETGAPLTFRELRNHCGVSFPALSPQCFSFNSPLGMCTACNGLGTRVEVDAALIVPDPTHSMRGGAIAPSATGMARG